MSAARIQPADLQRLRGLLDEVELLLRERSDGRRAFAKKAAQALEKRLREVEDYNHGGCRTCHEAEARAFLAKLQKISDGG